MNKLLIAVTLSLSILLEALGGNSVGALTIRSWNSANQRGGAGGAGGAISLIAVQGYKRV